MNYNRVSPIYLQIVEYICSGVVERKYMEGERLPSVNELGVSFGVNPNIAMRAYEWLEGEQLVYNKSGVGFFVALHAREAIIEDQQSRYFSAEVAAIITKMRQSSISEEMFVEYFRDEYSKISANQ